MGGVGLVCPGGPSGARLLRRSLSGGEEAGAGARTSGEPGEVAARTGVVLALGREVPRPGSGAPRDSGGEAGGGPPGVVVGGGGVTGGGVTGGGVGGGGVVSGWDVAGGTGTGLGTSAVGRSGTLESATRRRTP
ncbi:MAG TPA: hypothetical protein VFG15_05830 [Amycolatopsis sp.]|nr:hypothetical protein [Amycolatopsis sp.]